VAALVVYDASGRDRPDEQVVGEAVGSDEAAALWREHAVAAVVASAAPAASLDFDLGDEPSECVGADALRFPDLNSRLLVGYAEGSLDKGFGQSETARLWVAPRRAAR
jgi:hypothetical protein